ncbi:MFS transporter [Amycolatopsis sp. K13G38]|uniref:MFS transporter n=1 Tax=Amycolatopsis acididurans TaxID=2724524 RepID=A0ABX1JLZ9_9PSEU|nr:MFS transporter [Amycolatopsis acididurans]NKQ59287.1 MFS transporter [Amycolatopsis acididurans]
MTARVTETIPPTRSGTLSRLLWQRQLQHYPGTGRRFAYLAIAVLATIILYYELYLPSAVSPAIMAHYNMSFSTYVWITALGNLLGAFASLVAGLADRWGRANLVVYGLAVTGLLVLLAMPHAPNGLVFALVFAAISFVEGIILVATPALVRDFSPQLGRASAMGFWTLGPVAGSLLLSLISSNTLDSLPDWRDQFTICGITGLAMFVVALFGLRELSPRLRDQLMVSLHDRVLIEAKAKGIDIEESLRRPWRQMMHVDILGSAFAIAVFLIIYYTAVGFFPVYFTTLFGFSLADANGLGNWFWAADAIALIAVGIVSDKARVRKPFMVFGALGTVAMTIVFLTRTSHPDTGYFTFAWIISLLAVFTGITYAPWMASFTETVERRNPALTATGLAVWGWIVRVVVAVSIGVLPFVITSMSPLVEHGAQVQTLSQKYAAQLKTLAAVDPATQAALSANPNDPAAATRAVGEIAAAEGVAPTEAIARLRAVAAVPAADLAYLKEHGSAVQQAAHDTPGQWQSWWWVCVGGEVVFLPLILVMAGRWSSRRAREDIEAHEEQVRRELAALRGEDQA